MPYTVIEDGASSLLIVEDTPTEILLIEDAPVEVLVEAIQGPRGVKGDKGDTGLKGDNGDKGDQGIQGETGASPAFYTHLQSIASASWVVPHGLGRIPQVTVIDSGGDEVEGSYQYPDLNTAILNFSAPFGGSAYLS